MTNSVQELLNKFEALPDDERQEAAIALLRRVLRDVPTELPEESLVAAADALFVELDAREANSGPA